MGNWMTGSKQALERLEPCAGKLARTVLRGVGSSNAACLLYFAFLGSQYKLNVGGDDFYIDMLFYHTRLRCYFVIELKAGKFQPEYTGKLGFYVTAVNRQLKHESDQPTIGILLCKQANKLVVEYALQENKQPMGVASYTSGLPNEYQKLIPSKEQFQHLLDTLPEDEKDLK